MATIWILNHYADTPDRQATRSYDIGRELVRRGHRVTIFASSFSHYTLREERLQAGERSMVEEVDGVRFVWLKTFPYSRNNWRRFLNMAGFAWRAYRVGSSQVDSPDVIIGVTVHPLAALSAYLLSRRKKSRYFFEITDLWPQTLIEMGILSRRSPATWALRLLEKFLLRRAEKIITLWPHADRYITSLGIPESKVVWIPHCVEMSRYPGLDGYDGTLGSTFTIMYIGGHTSEYGLNSIIDAAQILEQSNTNRARFVFVGGGTEKNNLMRRAQEMGLTNVEFRDVVPKHDIARVLSEAGAFVFSRRSLQLFKEYGISNNKLCDYLASGRPILFACEARNNPVKEADAGITVKPEDPQALADAVVTLMKATPAERVRMAQNGRDYAEKHHDVVLVAAKLEALI